MQLTSFRSYSKNLRFPFAGGERGLFLVGNEVDDDSIVGPMEKLEIAIKYSRILDVL